MTDSQPPSAVSNLQIMRALLAKDWRLCRTMMIGLIALGAACYLIIGSLALYSSAIIDFDSVLGSVCIAALIACVVSSSVASAFGGAAIAGERIDRTADFLAVLPVTRLQIALSKLTVSTIMLGLCTAFHLSVAALSFLVAIHLDFLRQNSPDETHRAVIEISMETACWLGCTASFFGVAWLLSSFMRSATISAGASLGLTIFVFISLAIPRSDFLARQVEMAPKLGLVPLLLGLVSLIAGTLYYLRRVAP